MKTWSLVSQVYTFWLQVSGAEAVPAQLEQQDRVELCSTLSLLIRFKSNWTITVFLSCSAQLGGSVYALYSAPSAPVQVSCHRTQSWALPVPTSLPSDMSLWPWTSCCPSLRDTSWRRQELDCCCGTKKRRRRKKEELEEVRRKAWWKPGKGLGEERWGVTQVCPQLQPQHPQQWPCLSPPHTLQGN